MAKIPFLKKNFVTPAGPAVFPRLSTPDTKFDKRGEYSVAIRLTPEEAEPVRAQLEALRAEFHAQSEKHTGEDLEISHNFPLRPEKVKNRETGKKELTGNFLLGAKMKASGERDGKRWTQQPGVVDAQKNPVSEVVGGGSTIKIAGAIRAYYGAAVGGFGITFDLKAVQVLDLVASGGVAAAIDQFDAEDDGFTSAGGPAKRPASAPAGGGDYDEDVPF